MEKELGIYIHIPFCIKKCNYCDFLSGQGEDKVIEDYVKALLREIEGVRERSAEFLVKTVFIGGGTPSILKNGKIESILEACRKKFCIVEDAEITLEANPGTLTKEKLKEYKRAGINRLSIGVQSLDNKDLKILGRIHTVDDFLSNYEEAREEGFRNINIDLMSALPGQTVDKWEKILLQAAKLKPEHISAYSLIIEEGTPFYEKYGSGEGIPDEDTDRKIYETTKKILKSEGYARYEISNYARKGFECRHNLSYWERTDYLGMGLGASSLLNNIRSTNEKNLKEYIKYSYDRERIKKEEIILSPREQMEEFMFLGLRICTGVSKKNFLHFFGKDLEEVYGKEMEQLKKQGLIEEEGDRLKLTDWGIDISNYVFSQFLQ